MSLTLLNRITLLLAFAGIFVAGVLSMAHVLAVDVPCGGSGGCHAVAQHPTSFWFGVPVAYFGLVAYAALAALASVRGAKGVASSKLLIQLGFAITVAGTIVSLYLTYVSIAIIGQTCRWCLASAGLMILLFLTHAMMFQEWAEPNPDRVWKPAIFDIGFPVALFLAAIVSLGAYAVGMEHGGIAGAANVQLLEHTNPVIINPPTAHFVGKADAKVTIVEFGDLMCPSCRKAFPEIRRISDESQGRIKFVFRHFPLIHAEGHEMALTAALMSEYADEKGKFWEFVSAIYAAGAKLGDKEMSTPDQVYAVALSVNLDPNPATPRMKDPNDPMANRVYADMLAGNSIGINYTPTYVVFAEGLPPRAVLKEGLLRLLDRPEYKNLYVAAR